VTHRAVVGDRLVYRGHPLGQIVVTDRAVDTVEVRECGVISSFGRVERDRETNQCGKNTKRSSNLHGSQCY
jgi:hypothetical protein